MKNLKELIECNSTSNTFHFLSDPYCLIILSLVGFIGICGIGISLNLDRFIIGIFLVPYIVVILATVGKKLVNKFKGNEKAYFLPNNKRQEILNKSTIKMEIRDVIIGFQNNYYDDLLVKKDHELYILKMYRDDTILITAGKYYAKRNNQREYFSIRVVKEMMKKEDKKTTTSPNQYEQMLYELFDDGFVSIVDVYGLNNK